MNSCYIWRRKELSLRTHKRKSSMSMVRALFLSNPIFSRISLLFSFMLNPSGKVCHVTRKYFWNFISLSPRTTRSSGLPDSVENNGGRGFSGEHLAQNLGGRQQQGSCSSEGRQFAPVHPTPWNWWLVVDSLVPDGLHLIPLLVEDGNYFFRPKN